MPEELIRERQATTRAIIIDIQRAHPKLKVFDPLPYLCTQNECIVGNETTLYYRDSHHLSYRGSQYLSKPLLKWLDTQDKR